MAKKTRLTKEQKKIRDQIERERARLEDYMELQIVSEVECESCEARHEHEQDGTTEADTKLDHSRELYENGWREIESPEDGSIYLACKECVKKSGG